jgi:ribosomal protein L34E
MYRPDNQSEFPGFYLPFGGKLDPENRWIKLASVIPWHLAEEDYERNFAASGMGAPAFNCRIALGALIIKERLGVTDEETVHQIRENPCLQYFLGLREYLREDLFEASMMVHFRKRITPYALGKINDAIIALGTGKPNNPGQASPTPRPPDQKPPEDSGTPPPGDRGPEPSDAPLPAPDGRLLIDATCTPADITYPTDLKLLNEAREKTEHIIDVLHAPLRHRLPKPRTYRQKARRAFLEVALSKKPRTGKIRKAIGKQLRFLRRNLGHIRSLLDNGADLGALSAYWYKCLLVIHTLYEQQLQMYQTRTHRCEDRIVSISQPHIRPIVRGKVSQSVEFGAKISASVVDGYISLERLSWDAYNETNDLKEQAGSFQRRFGHYPASIHADKIYQTRSNRAWCKEMGIRLSGRPLGRPRELSKEEKRQQRQDERDRIPIEGKFGNLKRKGSLQRVMAKLALTGSTVIGVAILTLNLDQWLRFLCALIAVLPSCAHTTMVSMRRFLPPFHLLRCFPSYSPGTLAAA